VKRSGDSTHPCRSPTSTVNGWELRPPTRTHHSDLTASNRRPSITVLSQHYPKLDPRHPVVCFRGRQNMCRSLGHTPESRDFSKTGWRAKISSAVLRPGQKPHWVTYSFKINYFAACFFKALHIHYSRWAKQRDAPALVRIITEFANVSVPFQKNRPLSAKEILLNSRLWALSRSNIAAWTRPRLQCFDSWEGFGCSDGISAIKCTSCVSDGVIVTGNWCQKIF